MSYFAHAPAVAAEWWLLVVTGFLGGLTTFSAFSMEGVSLLRSGRYLMCLLLVLAHVGGAMAATGLGVATFELLRR